MNKKAGLALLGVGLITVVTAIVLATRKTGASPPPLPVGDDLGVTLTNLDPSATTWELNLFDSSSTGGGTNYIPVTQTAYFNASSWVLPFKIMLTVYSGTSPLTQILYVESYMPTNIDGTPNPDYKPIFITKLGSLTFDCKALTFS
jgi:hypothetical protein